MGSSFIFRIDEVRDTSEVPGTIGGVATDWVPSISPGGNTRVPEGVCGTWWSCDGQSISAIREFPQGAKLYKTYSMFYKGGFGFWVMQGDATAPPSDSTWQPLQFDHGSNYSSYLCSAAEHRTVACRRTNQHWLSMLLPDIYYNSTAFTPYDVYGKLKGELPIFLALVAFAIDPTRMQTTLPHMFTNGRWNLYNGPDGRRERRGVIVYVYTSSTTTAADLESYEDSGYFN